MPDDASRSIPECEVCEVAGGLHALWCGNAPEWNICPACHGDGCDACDDGLTHGDDVVVVAGRVA